MLARAPGRGAACVARAAAARGGPVSAALRTCGGLPSAPRPAGEGRLWLPPQRPSPGTDSAEHPPAAPADVDPALVDRLGRRHQYLRLSLTDRCNLRCQYCSPEEGEEPAVPSQRGEALTAAEIQRALRLFVDLGVRKIRLTGGEPTIRGDFGSILEGLGELQQRSPEPVSMGITTNGVRLGKLLPQLHTAGVRNINLSLDTLVAAKFPLLVRREMKWHTRIMDVLRDMASDDSGFRVKINCVLLRGVNEEELGDFVNLTRDWPIEVRFLEFMPFAGNSWSANRLVPQADIVEAMQGHLERIGAGPAERLPPDSLNDVARLWHVPGWRGRIGVIASMTDAFCGGCNRIRLTANGELRNCLFGETGWSLRDAMREGATDEGLSDVIATAVKAKHAKLGGKRDMHELRQRGALNLPMMALGG